MQECVHWWKNCFRFWYLESESKCYFSHGLKLIINHIMWVFIYNFVWLLSWWVLAYITMSIFFWITKGYQSVTDKRCCLAFNRGLKKNDLIFFCKRIVLSDSYPERIIPHFDLSNKDNFNLGLLLLLYSLPFSYNLYCYLLPVFTHSQSLHIPLVLLLLSYLLHPSIIITVTHMIFR